MRKLLFALVGATAIGTTALAAAGTADAHRLRGRGYWAYAHWGHSYWGYGAVSHSGWGLGGPADAPWVGGAMIAATPYGPYPYGPYPHGLYP